MDYGFLVKYFMTQGMEFTFHFKHKSKPMFLFYNAQGDLKQIYNCCQIGNTYLATAITSICRDEVQMESESFPEELLSELEASMEEIDSKRSK